MRTLDSAARAATERRVKIHTLRADKKQILGAEHGMAACSNLSTPSCGNPRIARSMAHTGTRCGEQPMPFEGNRYVGRCVILANAKPDSSSGL
jgi:hypothetical protein